jgi:hypothetical protein
MKNAYERSLYRQGYRMPKSCRSNYYAYDEVGPVTYPDPSVRFVRRPSCNGRALWGWVIVKSGCGWLVSSRGYFTVNGARKAADRKLAELNQLEIDEF